MSQSLSTGADFTNESFVVEIPANEGNSEPSDFIIPQLFNVTDDDIDEVLQSFVLVAEIGLDVPEIFTCFQRAFQSFIRVAEVPDGFTCLPREEMAGEIGCNANMEPTARSGATRIHINDDDGKCVYLYYAQFLLCSTCYNTYCCLYQSCIIAAMIIGFAQRRQTVSEADRPRRQDQLFPITVDVRSMVVSEINYNISFLAPASNLGRTATVGDNGAANIHYYDALFGYLNATTDLEDLRLLFSGNKVPETPLTITIINDMNPEPVECFTIDIASPDIAGDRETFACFDDDAEMDSFFCLHEICIVDDDGECFDIHLDVLLK